MNFPVSVKPAVRASTVLDARGSQLAKMGVRLSDSPASLAIAERPAANIQQIDFDLAHQSFTSGWANRAGNTQDWTNPANVNGVNNATNARWTVLVGALLSGTIAGACVAQPSRPSSLLIQEVWLQFYGAMTGIPVVDLLAGVTLGYRIGTTIPGLDTTCQRYGVNTNFAGGVEFRIDDGDGSHFTDLTVPAGGTQASWANIALIQPFVTGAAVVGLIPVIDIDAVRLRVVAQELWNP